LTGRPKILFIGAGLAACMAAHELADDFEVIILDRSSNDRPTILDVGFPSGGGTRIAYGRGGTTQLWHNGLIPISKRNFERYWPKNFNTVVDNYDAAYQILGGTSQVKLGLARKELVSELCMQGVPENLLGESLFYPHRRVNSSNILRHRKINWINGAISEFRFSGPCRTVLSEVSVITKNGLRTERADVFVLAAGGLNTPGIIREIYRSAGLGSKQGLMPGLTFEDHPMSVVAGFRTAAPLYRLWNWRLPDGSGTIRVPLVTNIDGIDYAFYIKPSYSEFTKSRFLSHLSELRNNPLSFENIGAVLRNKNDLFEVFSLKLGLNYPTENYVLLMVAGQKCSTGGSVRNLSDGTLIVDWNLTQTYLNNTDRAIDSVLESISGFVKGISKMDWRSSVKSSAHFSATAPMASDPLQGVCDQLNRVFGFDNVYTIDGSAIPSSGYANTGLTIAAMAKRFAQHAVSTFK
jgi:hypothetical protein